MAEQGILILTTGGTIDKNYFDALSEYQIVDSGIPALLKEARVALPYRLIELMRKDSLELTDADRALIASAAREAPETRIVVTHGTDTMTETAKVLAAEVPGKTIVLTGALIPRPLCRDRRQFQPRHGLCDGASCDAGRLDCHERAGV
jgi:L-asparaginase